MDDFDALATENLNIRYLAWGLDPDSNGWSVLLQKECSLEKRRAWKILNGETLTSEERMAVVEGFGVDRDIFSTAKLMGMSDEEIVQNNMVYLIRNLPQGEQKKMAQAMSKAPETVSRWSKIDNLKGRKNQNQLYENLKEVAHYLGLKPRIDLSKTPLFLCLQPVGQFAQRDWLRKRIDELSPEELTDLFPAFIRLLQNRENY
jgi:hypothetical protein